MNLLRQSVHILKKDQGHEVKFCSFFLIAQRSELLSAGRGRSESWMRAPVAALLHVTQLRAQGRFGDNHIPSESLPSNPLQSKVEFGGKT